MLLELVRHDRSIVAAAGGLWQVVKNWLAMGVKAPNRFYATSILKRDVGRLPSVD